MTLTTKTLTITPSKALLAASPALASFLRTGVAPSNGAQVRVALAYAIVTERA